VDDLLHKLDEIDDLDKVDKKGHIKSARRKRVQKSPLLDSQKDIKENSEVDNQKTVLGGGDAALIPKDSLPKNQQ